MKRNDIEYWSMFYFGSSMTICSKHRSLQAARKAAKACEKRGGTKHWIVKVEVVLKEGEV